VEEGLWDLVEEEDVQVLEEDEGEKNTRRGG